MFKTYLIFLISFFQSSSQEMLLKRSWYLIKEDTCDLCPGFRPKKDAVIIEFYEDNKFTKSDIENNYKLSGVWKIEDDSLKLSMFKSDTIQIKMTFYINILSHDSLVLSRETPHGTNYTMYKAR